MMPVAPFLCALMIALAGCSSLREEQGQVQWGADDFQDKEWLSRQTMIEQPSIEKDSESSQNPGTAGDSLQVQARWPEVCKEWMAKLENKESPDSLQVICQDVKVIDGCMSIEAVPIFHFERPALRKEPEKILAFALIHGDELPSGLVAKAWMRRLSEIDPRNQWRIIPVLNPDGLKRKSRLNARGIDLNRNFPSEDWDENALKAWQEKTKSDPRRYPGPSSASEPETNCAMKHIDEFNPDLIISIHTPYGVLDFDGPKMGFPKVNKLPWVSLGTFPGSLGRYMWTDRNRPVLTIELSHNLNEALDGFDRLQDISGQVALMLKKRRLQKNQNPVGTNHSSLEDH